MTQELKDIFEGKKKPKVKTTNISVSEMEKQLKCVISEQKTIIKRTEINWQKVNSFVVNVPNQF